MSDELSKLYWDPLRDDRWNLSLWAWCRAAGDACYVIRWWCHSRRWLLSLPPPPPLPCTSPLSPLPWTCVCANGSTVRELLSLPHLCGLRRDDLGLLPSQRSCHLRKGEVRWGWDGEKRRRWRKRSDLTFKFQRAAVGQFRGRPENHIWLSPHHVIFYI